MSTRLDGGRREAPFLSAHRCPEVDVLPQHDAGGEVTCRGQTEADYLDVSSSRRSEEKELEADEGEDEEEEEGSISDWSEEDLSLHFSPSVIHPSDESDPESGFECIDVTMETHIKGHPTGGLKMVPKRQIQLKKRETENAEAEGGGGGNKRQVMMKDRGGGGADGDLPAARQRPDLLLRQHSMPASFHLRSTTGGEVEGCRIYKGLIAGAGQGFNTGGNPTPRRLQKSFSLDETKTKMASCIIKSVLSKKMQVEQSVEGHVATNGATKASNPQGKNQRPPALPGVAQPAQQERMREGGGGGGGGGGSGGGGENSCPAGRAGGAFKAPVHVVRDMRSLVKNTYSLSFRNNNAATAQTHTCNKPTTFKVIGQDDSPPPSYQQAVGVKGHQETKKASAHNSTSRGYVAKMAATLCQPQEIPASGGGGGFHPVAQRRRGSEPIISRKKAEDEAWPDAFDRGTKAPALGHSERGVSRPPPPASARDFTREAQPPLAAQRQSSVLGVSSQSVPGAVQPLLNSCFYAPNSLPMYPAALHPHLGSFVQGPLSYIPPLQLQRVQPAFHLLQRPQAKEEQGKTGGGASCGPDENLNRSRVDAVKPESGCSSAETHQQQLLCGVQSFLPGSDFLVNISGSAVAPGALFAAPAPCHMMLDPKSGRCFYVEAPPQPQRKMLLDPETGQFIQVLLPAAGSAPNSGVFGVCGANPAPAALNSAPTVLKPAPAVLSVMQFQQPMAVPSLYPSPCLPFALRTPTVNYTQHTSP